MLLSLLKISTFVCAVGLLCINDYTHALMGFGIWIFLLISFKKKDKPQVRQQKSSTKQSSSFNLWPVISWVLFWPIKLIIILLKDGSGKNGETSAQKYLRETREYYRKDMEDYRARQAKKKKLLEKADFLESQTKYQSGYKYNQTMQEIDQLRREAWRL